MRVHVIGNSCAGKSTLAERLCAVLEIPLVELDAINWQPNWHGLNEHDPEEFDRRLRDATSGDRWAVAGSYTKFSQRNFWPKLQVLIWLDLPLRTLVVRMLRRSWQRWRTRELLWGTNVESFWPQLAVWRGEDSLLWWIVTQYGRKRRQMMAIREDPQWAHIKFVHLRSPREIERFAAHVEKAGRLDV